ncbi:MAG: Zn-ribbon domain-containing OB-fold protein, partial [Burkholderiales bacterium]
MDRPAPVSNKLTKPFWDACNERRLVLQNCAACSRLHYPPTEKCTKCGSGNMVWKEVQGKGHIDV